MNRDTLHLVSAIAVVVAVGAWICLAMLYAWRCERAVREALAMNERMVAQNDELVANLASALNLLAERTPKAEQAEATHER